MNYKERFYRYYVSTQTLHLYGKTDLSIKKQFPVWGKYFRRFLPEKNDSNILDLGCGNGGFIYYLQSLGYKNCYGIDISKEQIEEAKKLGINNVEYADLKIFLRSKQTFYDVIFARDILEHFIKSELIEVLNLIYNSLKSNGIFAVQVPNAESPFAGCYRYGDFTHEISFTKSSIEQLLRVAEFREVEVYAAEPVIHGIRSVLRYLLWKCIKQVLKFYLLVETGASKRYIFTQNLIAVAKK